MAENEQNTEIDEALSTLNEEQADKFASWADLYSRLKASAAKFTEYPSPGTAAVAVATLVAFVLALEELPDEGDVVVIARKLNEILLKHPERTGVIFYVLEGNTQRSVEALAKTVRESLLQSAMDSAEESTPLPPTTEHKYLH